MIARASTPAPAPAPTPSQTVGPFFHGGLVRADGHEVVPAGAPGALRLGGQVLDGDGWPVGDALVELWQADGAGSYEPGLFGRSATDAAGRYGFVSVKPGPVPAAGGGATQAPHVVLTVFARGLLRHVVTRAYFPDEAEANERDPVLAAVPAARRADLVCRAVGGELVRDIRLRGDGESVFFDV